MIGPPNELSHVIEFSSVGSIAVVLCFVIELVKIRAIRVSESFTFFFS